MTRSILSLSLVIFLFFATVPSLTLAEPGPNLRHLDSLHNGHKATYTHGPVVYDKRKRGGTDSPSTRCRAHPRASPVAEPNTEDSQDPHAVPAGGSKKWGLAWPNGDASYLANFARPRVRYLYSWSPYLPSDTSTLGYTGVPMLWGWNQVDDFNSVVVEGYATHVLGMNEPNEPSQSNMSPQDGISLWKQHIDPLKSQGYYLISPACTNDQAGLDWMKAFVEGCDGCTIDAIAFHFYGTDSEAFIKHATTLHDTYDKPIWVTEFADQNFSGSGGQASMSDIYAFQSVVVDFVERTPWFEAAFPFGVMHDLQGVNEGNSLLTADGWPTSLAYNYFG